MDADERRLEMDRITERIIGCAYKISNTLGSGFLEKVYENALAYEIKQEGFEVDKQYGLKVLYNDVIVGEYVADLLVENQVLIEVKAVKTLDTVHIAQCLNYLKATKLNVCLLINFGIPKVEIRRIVNDF